MRLSLQAREVIGLGQRDQLSNCLACIFHVRSTKQPQFELPFFEEAMTFRRLRGYTRKKSLVFLAQSCTSARQRSFKFLEPYWLRKEIIHAGSQAGIAI